MRRPMTAFLIATILALAAAGAVLIQEYRGLSADHAETKAAEKAARSNVAEAFDAIAEIQDSLSAISTGDEAIQLRSRELRAELKLTEPSRREVLESIALLKSSIERAKARIGRLEAGMNDRGTRIAGLEKTIANLKRSLAERETHASLLAAQVDTLQTRVAGLETAVQQDQAAIAARDSSLEDQRSELATVQYIIGSKKDLASSGVIVSKGGVLGLGRTIQLSGRYDESRFTAMDTDRETVLRAPSSRAQVLSPQPTSSYELRVEGNQIVLRILDPREFRKVRHLVILTA
jgi:uncharacterized coiled-coil protein SlyX